LKKIRLLNITFDAEIKPYEIPAFRGAIIDKAGPGNTLFHNHLAGDAFLYKYPLIQYKTIGGKPCIICIEYGVDEIHKFFDNKNWDIKISDRWLEMKISSLNMNQFTMQVWDKKFRYNIKNWIALNQENVKKYEELESLTEKIQFLEKILTGNILSMAKGIEWEVDKPIQLNITEIHDVRPVSLKGKKLHGFNLDFTTNVFLPNHIGLGKSVSVGYGVVRQKRERTEKPE
jgi:hypothetical protein